MNRGAFQSPSVHQLMGGGPATSLWSLYNMRPTATATHHPQQIFPLLPSSSSSSSSTPSSSSSSSVFQPYSQPLNLQRMAPWHDNQDQPESWSQLLLGGLVEEVDRCSFTTFQTKKLENWDDPVVYSSAGARVIDIKQELSVDKGYNISGQAREELQVPMSSWSQILPNSSPRSCVTTSFNSSMLDFSNSSKAEARHHQLDHSSQECNSTPSGSPYKKARVQTSSSQSTFKVRKEKLGDRITALHQLVSPFGKTDTASVLLESIGYIRFLHSQIEALSSPYLATGGTANMKQPALLNDNCMKIRGASDQDGVDHVPKDLRSRGLCLVPVPFTLHVGSDNGADYWAPTFGGGFR